MDQKPSAVTYDQIEMLIEAGLLRGFIVARKAFAPDDWVFIDADSITMVDPYINIDRDTGAQEPRCRISVSIDSESETILGDVVSVMTAIRCAKDSKYALKESNMSQVIGRTT